MNARDSYRYRMSRQLSDWRTTYDSLVSRSMRGNYRTRYHASRCFDLLHERRYQVFRSLDELKYAGDDGWEPIRRRTDAAWEALRAATGDVVRQINFSTES